ncbi:MAG: hypothetical protein ACLTLQ_12180 [[Clostridium] scindens]
MTKKRRTADGQTTKWYPRLSGTPGELWADNKERNGRKNGLSSTGAFKRTWSAGLGTPRSRYLEILAGTMGISVSALLEVEVKNASLVKKKVRAEPEHRRTTQDVSDVLAVSPIKSRTPRNCF